MTPKEMVEFYLSETDDSRQLAQKCRDYFDHKQWTEAEAAKLKARAQAPIVVNRVKPKVEGLVGLYELRKTDPKAFPVTQKHEEASEPITDALRYVSRNNKFDITRLDVAEDFFVEGVGGVFIDAKPKKGEMETQIFRIPWDRIIYDPRSRKKDFSDARFMGLMMWLDFDQAKDMFNLSQKKFDQLQEASQSEDYEGTTEDRPRWSNNVDKRARIAILFYSEKSKWKMCVFSGDTEIIKKQDSPYKDEDGLPTNPIELVSANIDRENNRYGEVAGFLSQQDEINHRRSKFLHLNSTRQTYGNENAISDIEKAKREFAKPNGHIQLQGGAKFGDDFGVIPQGDFSNSQFNLYMDAKSELDAVSMNAQLAGERQNGDLSGKAIDKLQQAGTLELNRQYALLRAWENRVYTQVWWRIKQFWNAEKWIRVTDDHEDLRWVGFNTKVTAQQLLVEAANDESRPPESRMQSQQILQLLTQTENPRLNELVEVRNPIPELEMDIIIDQSFDVINIQQEQFDQLAQFAQGRDDIDIIELIELSQLRGKDELIAKIQRRRQERANAQDPQSQLDQAERVSKIQRTNADTENIKADTVKKNVDAVSQQVQTLTLQQNPDPRPQVSV